MITNVRDSIAAPRDYRLNGYKRHAIFVPLAIVVTMLAANIGRAQTIPIPPEFKKTYDDLQSQVQSFEKTVKVSWPGTPYPVNYAPQLLTANSDQYTTLLQNGYYAGVLSELMELQALGANTVTVHINFPVLYQPYYTADPSLYQQFVDFYTQLATDIHSRGMKLIVESTTAQPLVTTQGASFGPYYASLTWNQYMSGRAKNVVNVAQLVSADYISVITEPDSEQSASGQANAGTVTGSTQLLNTILTALKNASSHSALIGAGCGSWNTLYTQFLQSFAATTIDYVDTHVYPANLSGLTNLLLGAPIIHGANKPMAISEAWLNKVDDSEIGMITGDTVAARNAFSFWGPLDVQFLSAISDFSQWQQVLFMNPYWSCYFSANLDYNVYGTESNADILKAESQAAYAARQTGSFTSTGHGWENKTIPAPDTQAPAVPAAPTATVIGATSVTLAWTPTTDNIGVASYNVYRNGTLITTSNSFSYYDGTLTSGGKYNYTINAFDAPHNTSKSSAPLSVQTIDNVPPSAPTNLVVTKFTSTSVTLQWTRSLDNVGVTDYIILRGSSPTTLSNIGTTNSDPYTDPHCAPNTSYYYAVKAQDARGNTSGQSNVVNVTTSN